MTIKPGKNIALKVPLHVWQKTCAFYRDRVGLKVIQETDDSVAFEFGGLTLWLDRVMHQSQTDIWLELLADDPKVALQQLGSPKRDELEPLHGIRGHWTSDPAGIVILVRSEKSLTG